MSKFNEIIKSASVFVGLKEDEEGDIELFDYEKEKNRFDIRYKKAFLRNRKRYGFFTFAIVAFWLIVMLYIVLAQGLGHLPKKDSKFILSEPIIIALITTTTINVLALLIIVLRNLFQSSDKNAPTE